MYTFLLVTHVLAAVLLVVVVLIQRGRGGGLVESFSGVESMFGTKTSQFLTRATALLATLFLVTSISLAVLAARQTRSLIGEEPVSAVQQQQEETGGQTQAVQQEAGSQTQAVESESPPAQEGEGQALQEEETPD